MSELYWAAKSPKDCVSECMARKTDYYQYITQSGIKYVWMLVYLMKFTATESHALPVSAGEHFEFQDVRVNDFRNLLIHKAGIIKNQRTTWEPMAVNDDVTSLAQTKIAKSILDMYTSHKDYDKKFNELVNIVVSFGEAFALQTWDAFRGKLIRTLPTGEYNEDGSQKVANFYEGDVDMRVYEPIDVIRDCYVMNHDQNKWFIFRDRVNKWELAAKHPDLYDNIVSKNFEPDMREYYTNIWPLQQSKDLVTKYTFVHQKTSALPEGRIIEFLDEDTILSASKLTYDDLPYHRMVDMPISHANFSYTDAFDMLEVEYLTDRLWSTIITNQSMFGVQNIIMPKGSDISEMDLKGAMNLITYDPATGGKPESLNLLATPREIFETLGSLENKKNTISGVNSTAQGNPPNDVSSGTAISMLQSLNVQYSQGAQGSFIEIMTSIGTALLNILKQNAKSERLIEFTGSESRSLLQKFTGKDINSIARVIAKPGNALTQTIQGRFTIAQMLAQMGMVKDSDELLEVLETGNLDVLTEGAEMQLIYAQQENEQLQEAVDIQVHPFDDHISHLRKHIGLISDISVRAGKVVVKKDASGNTVSSLDPTTNPEGQKVLTAVTNHMMQHIQYLKNENVASLLPFFGYQGPQPEAAPGALPSRAGQAPNGTIHIEHKLGPSPKNGAKLPPAAAAQQPTTVAEAAGNLTSPVGEVPTAAIKTAQKAPKPREPHRG